ncbi:hypothetical protein NPX99_08230 [Bartonella sp. 220]|uniref:hypothetical protein n=1 Tax=Bartonella sp. 220B TaxID=2967260 RepID=UPI0022A8E165|nr:hypothetical protein [Bartonella sp. 220B]MCZ2159222.1 hypothetical protein [Bartonella sp. 220B]
MFKRCILLSIAISTLLLANHANGEKQIECANGKVPVYRNSSFIKCVSKQDAQKDAPDWLKKYKLLSIHEQTTKHASLEHICANGEIPVLRDVRDPSSVIKCIPETDYDKSLLPEWAKEYKVLGISEEDYNERLKHRFNKDKIIEWLVIGLVIIAIMSLPINILWRFRFKIPAYLFAMVTALAVIAIPFIFGW